MKESSKFYSSLGLLVMLNLIIKPAWIFLIDRQVQNHVGAGEYGIYFSLLNFSIVLSFLLDWGLTAYINRRLAAAEGLAKRIGDFLLIRLLFILVYVLVIALGAWLTGIQNWSILLAVSGIQVLTSLFLFLRSIITAQQWFRADAWLSVLDKTIMIIVCGAYLYAPAKFGQISIHKFLLVQLFATGIAVLLATFILIRNKTPLFQFNKKGIGAGVFKAALPFGIIVLLMSAHYRLDGFLLERLHKNGAYEAGLYAGAYRLLDAANMIGFLFSSFLLPFITRQVSLNKNISDVVLNTRHILILLAIFVSIMTFFLAPWMQKTLYYNNDKAAIDIIRLCLPALLGYSLVQAYGTVLTATGKIVAFCWIVLLSLAINIILNLLLIPSFGAVGCCVAALVSQGCCGIITMVYASKTANISLHPRSLLLYFFIGIITAGILYLCVISGVREWVQIVAAGTSMLLLSFVTGLFDRRRWRDFLYNTTLK